MRVQLPCGAVANVSPGVSRKTLRALNEMMSLAAKQFSRPDVGVQGERVRRVTQQGTSGPDPTLSEPKDQ